MAGPIAAKVQGLGAARSLLSMRGVMGWTLTTLLVVLRGIGWVVPWLCRHRRWAYTWFVVLGLAMLTGGSGAVTTVVALWAAPAVVSYVWHVTSPVSYERWIAGPARRRS